MVEKTVGIDELYENHPSDFQDAYENWVSGQHMVIDEDLGDIAFNAVKDNLIGTGWCFESSSDVKFSLSFTQGDGVAVLARFDIENVSDLRIDEMKHMFPMNTELMRLELFYIETVLTRTNHSRIDWTIDEPFFHNDEQLIEDGMYKGMPVETLIELADEEGFQKFAEYLYEDIEKAESAAYSALVEDYEFQTSQELFIEQARDLDMEFEVEDEQLSA